MAQNILSFKRFYPKSAPTAWSEEAGYQRRVACLAEVFAGRGIVMPTRLPQPRGRRPCHAVLHRLRLGNNFLGQRRPAPDLALPAGKGRAFPVRVKS